MELINKFNELGNAIGGWILATVVLCTTLQGIFMFLGKWFPRAATAAHALGTFAVDIQKIGQGIKKVSGPKDAAAKAGPVALLFLVVGCSSLGHWKSPEVETATDLVCTLVGDRREAFLRDEAQRLGISFDDVARGLRRACGLRAGATREDVARESQIIAAGRQ